MPDTLRTHCARSARMIFWAELFLILILTAAGVTAWWAGTVPLVRWAAAPAGLDMGPVYDPFRNGIWPADMPGWLQMAGIGLSVLATGYGVMMASYWFFAFAGSNRKTAALVPASVTAVTMFASFFMAVTTREHSAGDFFRGLAGVVTGAEVTDMGLAFAAALGNTVALALGAAACYYAIAQHELGAQKVLPVQR